MKGLPGVERFSGPGSLGLVREFLFDKRGNIATPEGFTRAVFSSRVERWG